MKVKVKTPISRETIGRLKVGDVVHLDGIMFTMRDLAHRRLLTLHAKGKRVPINFEGSVLYHCGPLVKREGGEWKVIAAGPTTSMRMEPFASDVVRLTKVRMIVGKGGMGNDTAKALRRYGAVYCDFTGGAAVLAAKAIKKVLDVKWLDLGLPEAIWVFEVKQFGPLLVTMDSQGRDYRESIRNRAKATLSRLREHYGNTT
jgi:fumarate hydratase subunit beta